jgi:uncharacterized protein (DUF1697 family)
MVGVRYAALLRAVNLGGNSKIAMADLRELLAGIGYSDVSTYVQSGNAVFTGPDEPATKLQAAIAEAIAGQLGVRCAVMVRTAADLAATVSANPLGAEPENPSRYFVAFLGAQPNRAAVTELTARSFEPERVWVSGSHAYLWLPDGIGRAKLSNNAVEKWLGVASTTRNWNTVKKLAGMAASQA